MRTSVVGMLVLALLPGCVPEQPAEGLVRARFVMPVDGDTVPPDVRIVLASEGVRVAPASGRRRAGRAHHHVYINADLTPLDRPIPHADAEIVHLDGGETEHTIRNLPPGEHRLIAALARGDHVRMGEAATDTVWVIVRPRP